MLRQRTRANGKIDRAYSLETGRKNVSRSPLSNCASSLLRHGFWYFLKKRTRAKQGRGIHLQQKIGFQSGKDIVLKSKTSCFTVSDSSDR